MANLTVCENINIKLYFMYQFRKTQYVSHCVLRISGVRSKFRYVKYLFGILEFVTPDIDSGQSYLISARLSGC